MSAAVAWTRGRPLAALLALALAAVVLARYGPGAGGLAGAWVLLRGGKAARRQALPYGPFLSLGAVLLLLLATPGA